MCKQEKWLNVKKENSDELMRSQAKDIQIDDIEKLSYHYNEIKTPEVAVQNDYYGIATIIKEFANFPQEKSLNATIEHGLYFKKDYYWREDIRHLTKDIICMSELRKGVLEKNTFKNPCVIGPYIAYASSFYSKEKINDIRKKNGKTLLVMPSHSIDNIGVEYNFNEFINEIEFIKRNHDYLTVMVCLYWKDLSLGMWKPYMEKGYKIVSAGNIYDFFFLKRLHSIIDLSDAVMINDIGTNLGYAMFFRKPCYVFSQENRYIQNGFNKKYETKYAEEYFLLKDIFKNKELKITNKQIEVCNYVYGLDKIKTKEEMKNILEKFTSKKYKG